MVTREEMNERFYKGYLNQLRRGVKPNIVRERIESNEKFDGQLKELIIVKCNALIEILK